MSKEGQPNSNRKSRWANPLFWYPWLLVASKSVSRLDISFKEVLCSIEKYITLVG